MTFKENFKKLRKAKGFTQLQIAEAVNVDKTTVGKWEQIGTMPNEDTLKKLCEIFDCSLDYLLGRSDSPTPSKGMSPEKKEAFFKGLDDLQLDKYKNLTPEDKELLAAQFNALIDRLEKGKKE